MPAVSSIEAQAQADTRLTLPFIEATRPSVWVGISDSSQASRDFRFVPTADMKRVAAVAQNQPPLWVIKLVGNDIHKCWFGLQLRSRNPVQVRLD
jgi:hypothetical protein